MNLTVNPSVTMNSLEIADLVRSNHADVRRSIERLAERQVISLPPSAEVKVQRERREEKVKAYRFDGEKGKRDSIVVVAQMCPEFTAALVDRWQQLEQTNARLPAPADLSRMQILQLAMESEQARLQAEGERDHAIATKAQIGQRREATAMATASAAVREAGRLRNELGRGCQQATVTAVEIALNRKLGKQAFRPLKNWCDAQGIDAAFVQDARYGRVRAWPDAAWLNIYNIDLASLFSGEEVSA